MEFHLFKNFFIFNDTGLTIDSQCFAKTGYDKQNSNLRIQ